MPGKGLATCGFTVGTPNEGTPNNLAVLRLDSTNMYVCLCTGATSHVVANAVTNGACTSKEVAAACGAGTDCGRCRHTVRSIIESYFTACSSKTPTPAVAG
jgi:bacterioferritin-associated ferredoxin